MTATLEILITKAREHYEAGERFICEHFYRLVLEGTKELSTPVHRLARGEACRFFARMALADARLGQATDWYYDAINADPMAADYRVELARKALMPMTMYRDARIEAERATRIDPDNADAWRALGQAEFALGNADACIRAYGRQLELLPGDGIALLDMVTVKIDSGAIDEAEGYATEALDTKYVADATHALAMIAFRRGQFDTAIGLYQSAIDTGCHDPDNARWNASFPLLATGQFADGWEAHEARGAQKADGALNRVFNRFNAPRWKGQPEPARLHVHQEMGHGDVLAMARYLPMLVEMGHDVRFEVAEGTVDLMRDSLPGVKVMPKSLDYPGALGVPPFDYHIPMLSLPYLFKTEVNTIPWFGPYLRANPAKVAEMAPHVPPRAVGICWSSGVRDTGIWITEYGRRKSMHFDEMAALFDHIDISFVSLQAGPERAHNDGPALDLLCPSPTWADTASLIANLDIVITVDTAVAHLAGAMGKPVWVLVADHAASWHWMRERLDSPWYPSARVYRQAPADAPGWGRVIDEVAADLARWVRDKAA